MSLQADKTGESPAPSAATAAPGQARPARALCTAGLVVMALLGTGILAAGCGGRPAGQAVANLGTTTTTSEPPAAASANKASPVDTALAFAQCMRGHGEPNFPEPVFQGHSAHIAIGPSSGVDPNSPQFAAATAACKHFLPNGGVPSAGQTITPADEADYLKGAVCMRSHGFPEFPDPSFRDNNVTFKTSVPIDTNSSQYKSALATCEKLIPAGLPYSSPGDP